jgi:hypothetical protein
MAQLALFNARADKLFVHCNCDVNGKGTMTT